MDANDYFKSGNAAASANDWARAISDFSEAIRLAPNDPRITVVYNARGMAYYRKGEYDRAIGDFGEIIRLAPSNAKAYENRGKMYYYKKDYPRTIADFEKSLDLAPDNPILRENLEKIQAKTVRRQTVSAPPKVSPKPESANSSEPQDAQAQFQLGLRYENGWGVDKNAEEAAYWYAQAAKQGLAEAQYNLGFCYANGEGVGKNIVEAVKWYAKAAEQGLAQAQGILGQCYHKGNGVAQDTEKAAYWYAKAAKQGDPNAQQALKDLEKTRNDIGNPPVPPKIEPAKAVNLPQWRPPSDIDNLPPLQKSFQPSSPSPQSSSVSVDSGNASSLREGSPKTASAHSAEPQDASAQYNLARRYAHGEGVPKNAKQAAYWYAKAAEQGLASAQNTLGLCYLRGFGVNKDSAKKIYWYSKAAEQGFASAQYNLGTCYFNGYGVNKDEVKAAYWWTKAAKQGNASAQYNLGVCYFNGWGVGKDNEQAAYWQAKAAESVETVSGKDSIVKTFNSETILKALKIAVICTLCLILAVAVVSIARSVINHAVDSVITKTLNAGKDVVNHAIDAVVDKTADVISGGGGNAGTPISTQAEYTDQTLQQADTNSFTAPEHPKPAAFSPTHTVATNDRTNLRLRSSPSTKGEAIMSLPYGSSVQVLRVGDFFVDADGNSGNWMYVATPEGGQGWCFGAYLKYLGN
ncbi:MAG: tetratricopeptide repeat protein [Spirochaetaceae bacterium]|jgi:TPR repeat protein|nr:tetratricopeptide repeat protein [Spirochaetaceae bacterium]